MSSLPRGVAAVEGEDTTVGQLGHGPGFRCFRKLVAACMRPVRPPVAAGRAGATCRVARVRRDLGRGLSGPSGGAMCRILILSRQTRLDRGSPRDSLPLALP